MKWLNEVGVQCLWLISLQIKWSRRKCSDERINQLLQMEELKWAIKKLEKSRIASSDAGSLTSYPPEGEVIALTGYLSYY